jgi:SAM-dependent methyltransferase
MKAAVKSLLKAVRLYHPLQSTYRRMLFGAALVGWRIRYRKYQGKGYRCNFCGARYERFVPEWPGREIAPVLNEYGVIAGYGENVFCPRCGSKNRERLVKAVMEPLLGGESGGVWRGNKKILHFSPEPHLYRWLAAHAEVTTVDLEPGFYRSIDKGVRYADATALDFGDNGFDLVVANHVLEHVGDDRAAMAEMFRVLKPLGIAILQVPYSPTLLCSLEDASVTDPHERARRFGQQDHVRIYALSDYLNRLEAAGFRVQLVSPDELAPFRQFAIQPGESVVIGWKDGLGQLKRP